MTALDGTGTDAALAAGWVSLFRITCGRNGVWQAARRDGTGTVICALDPGDLAVRMRAAWEGPLW
jgi:hypothetical protein